MEKIKLVKLTNGQELMGKLVEEGFGWVVLEQIALCAVVPLSGGQYQIEPRPFSPTLPDAKWKIYTSQLLGEPLEVPENLQKWYVQATSGIEIVSSMGQMK